MGGTGKHKGASGKRMEAEEIGWEVGAWMSWVGEGGKGGEEGRNGFGKNAFLLGTVRL